MNKEQRITAIVTSNVSMFHTSHSIAKMLDCTPSYVRRICKKLFKQGRVAMRQEPHRGRSGFKTIYVSIAYARAVNNGANTPPPYILPDSVQMEIEF